MVDEIDEKIIAELYADADRPQKVIASKVGITEPTLSKRKAELVRRGIIRNFTIEIDFKKFGLSLEALTMCRINKHDSHVVDDFVSFIETMSYTNEIHKVAGEWDFAIIWRCRDSEHLDDLVKQLLTHPAADKVETTIFMRPIKRRGINPPSLPHQN